MGAAGGEARSPPREEQQQQQQQQKHNETQVSREYLFDRAGRALLLDSVQFLPRPRPFRLARVSGSSTRGGVNTNANAIY